MCGGPGRVLRGGGTMTSNNARHGTVSHVRHLRACAIWPGRQPAAELPLLTRLLRTSMICPHRGHQACHGSDFTVNIRQHSHTEHSEPPEPMKELIRQMLEKK